MKRRVSKAFVYLGPSAIHGIGCFADRDVRKGETIRIWDGEDSRWIPTAKAHASPQAHLIKRFGIRNHGGYWCPKDFLRISTGWYMNHSADPNTGHQGGRGTCHGLSPHGSAPRQSQPRRARARDEGKDQGRGEEAAPTRPACRKVSCLLTPCA